MWSPLEVPFVEGLKDQAKSLGLTVREVSGRKGEDLYRCLSIHYGLEEEGHVGFRTKCSIQAKADSDIKAKYMENVSAGERCSHELGLGKYELPGEWAVQALARGHNIGIYVLGIGKLIKGLPGQAQMTEKVFFPKDYNPDRCEWLRLGHLLGFNRYVFLGGKNVREAPPLAIEQYPRVSLGADAETKQRSATVYPRLDGGESKWIVGASCVVMLDMRTVTKLIEHSRLQHNYYGEYFRCQHCRSNFKKAFELVNHSSSLHSDPVCLMCPLLNEYGERECNEYRADTWYNLRSHIRRKHDDLTVNRHEDREMVNIGGHDIMVVSDSKTEDEARLRCPTCQRYLATAQGLRKHIAAKHPTTERKRWQCDRCPKNYADQRGLTDHIGRSHGVEH